MPRYVALLRGVNVGGSGRMAMADLRACVEGDGFEDVTTHIQTGNVLFRTPMRSAEKVARALEEAVEADLAFRTAVMVRTAKAKALVAPEGPDEVAVIGREVHLHYPDGMGRSKLSGAYIEKALGVPATARRRSVVEKIRDLLED